MFSEIILEALIDSCAAIPFLLIIYILIELFEYQFGDQIKKTIARAANYGPLVGAFIGAIPQCGFSVMATALYTQRLITPGTLLAVYLSTSDEAIPLMLAYPQGITTVFPFILTKIIIAIFSGGQLIFYFINTTKKP